MKFELTPRNLYILGIACFLVISAMNIIILATTYQIQTYWAFTASVANIIFNLGLAALFNYLRRITPEDSFNEPDSSIMDGAIEEFNKHDEHLGNEEENEEDEAEIKPRGRKKLLAKKATLNQQA
jgi:hypothetical protein